MRNAAGPVHTQHSVVPRQKPPWQEASCETQRDGEREDSCPMAPATQAQRSLPRPAGPELLGQCLLGMEDEDLP